MLKKLFKFFLFLVLALVTFLSLHSHARDFRWEKKISEGIDYIHIKKFTDPGWLHTHILKIDLQRHDIDVKPALAKDTIGMLEPVNATAKRWNAIAAINGSFFEARKRPYLPIGIIAIDGKMVNKSTLSRCAFGITAGKDIIFGVPNIKSKFVLLAKNKSFDIWGINRPRKNNEVILYTNEYGKRTKTNQYGIEIIVTKGEVSSILRAKGNSVIPEDGYVISLHGVSRKYADWIILGDEVLIEIDLGKPWQMMNHIVSGGPLLIRDGKIVVKKTVIEEDFEGRLLKRSARTAIGETVDKKLMLVVVDKRRWISSGLFYSELAQVMLEEGARNAMALDGGSSSTMYVDGSIVNYPSAGKAVAVSNAIIVKKAGWRLVAKKPIAFVKKPAEDVKKRIPFVEVTSKEAAEVPLPPTGLMDIYDRVIRILWVTGEAMIED